ncbi:hypothetical protein V7128_01090 [Neobacillus vireti]|uniref:hypothetical protein n=1 Tax=Neobacillus vireti TaxID=220686 RepID=UPI0030004531
MTLIIREGMSLNKGERIEVYYNLHKHTFSIKSLDNRNSNKNKVVAYSDNILLDNVTFHISEKILQNILNKKVKQVYATVRGYLVDTDIHNITDMKQGYINPYITKYFIDQLTGVKLIKADKVYFYNKQFSYII